jgi:hypothetical protein
MKPRLIFLTVTLVAMLVAVSCAPAADVTPIAVSTDAVVIPATEAEELVATPLSPTATQSVEVQAVATSRGPNLEATDPTTVSLASGQLHLVEFFRFT